MTDLANQTIVSGAHDVLRYATLYRIAHKLPIAWYEEGGVFRARPRDDKYDGAWLVSHNAWEQYYDTDAVIRFVTFADGYSIESLLGDA